jgi:hypothetical protein
VADGAPQAEPAGEGVNQAFHAAYGRAQDLLCLDTPVFVLLAEVLVVHHRGVRAELPVRPLAFHVIKAVSHAPVALFALLERGAPPAELASFGARLDAARTELRAECAQLPDADALDAVLADTTAFLSEVGAGLPHRADARSTFAACVGPRLLALAALATRLQLDALHAAVERALASFSDGECASLQVVVTGDHQARERSLGLQYFQRRLGEPLHGEEERVSYAEAVSDEAGALALVGTRKLDRRLAEAFFGDPRRLQRDVLGDAAAAQLGRMALAPIGGSRVR